MWETGGGVVVAVEVNGRVVLGGCFVCIRSTTSLGVDGIISVMFVRSDNLLCVEGSCSKSRETGTDK